MKNNAFRTLRFCEFLAEIDRVIEDIVECKPILGHSTNKSSRALRALEQIKYHNQLNQQEVKK